MPGSDNSFKALPSADVLAEPVATDHDGTAHHQYVKQEWGPDNTYNKVDDVLGKRLPTQISRKTDFAVAVIGSGGTASTVVDCRGADPTNLQMPAGFTGTVINFQGSADGVTFFDIYDLSNTRLAMTVAASRCYPLWGELLGWAYIKIVSASAQGSTVNLTIQLRS